MAFTKLEPASINTTADFTFANVSAGNVKTGNLLYANGSPWVFSTYANSNVASYLSTVTGNISAGNINVTGNVTSAHFVGSGNSLSNIQGANISGTVTSATIAGTITATSQPNISSVGTLTSLTISGVTTTTGGVKVGNIQDPSGTNTISLASGAVGMIGNLTIGTSGSGIFVAPTANIVTLNVTGTSTFISSQDITVSGTPSGTVNYDLYNGLVLDVAPTANWTANVGNIATTNNRATVVTFIITQGSTPYVPNVFQISGTTQTVNWVSGTVPTGTASKIDVVSYSLIRSNAGAWTVLGQSASYG